MLPSRRRQITNYYHIKTHKFPFISSNHVVCIMMYTFKWESNSKLQRFKKNNDVNPILKKPSFNVKRFWVLLSYVRYCNRSRSWAKIVPKRFITWSHGCCGQCECWFRKPVNHTSWVVVVTSTGRPKSIRNRCVIERFGGVFVLLPCLKFSVGIGALVIGHSQISSFFSWDNRTYFNILKHPWHVGMPK